ncbi:MAG: hypothetical protein ACLQQ4_12175 [Bacteroidia bacterium]
MMCYSEFDFENISAKANILNEKKITFNGTEYSLTKLTQELLKLDYAVQPTKFWSFKGKNLIDIYNETYAE